MLSENQMAQITALAEEVSVRTGCRLYDLEFVGQGRGRILRVYIDREGEPVSVDNCADVSRGLSLLLDVEDLIPGGAYELEVSSPGLERVLRKPWHFEQAVGKTMRLKMRQAVEPLAGEKPAAAQKTLQGELKSFAANMLTIQAQSRNWTVAFDNVEKAKLVFDYKPSPKAKIKKKR